jgi:electron transfer flavoprotein alpha subunit
MSILQKICVVAETQELADELVKGVSSFSASTTLFSAESTSQTTLIGARPALVDLIVNEQPQAVFVEASKNGRLIAAALGVAFGSSVMTDVVKVEVLDSTVQCSRLVYGGAATQIEQPVGSVAVICIGSGVLEVSGEGTAARVDFVAQADERIRVLEKRPMIRQAVQLAGASTVVAVGRGIGNQENLGHVEELASVINGVVGSTRPVAEEEQLLPKETYIGISGAMLTPELYIGIGVSGQVQHMIGVSQAKTIVAINKDKSAPIFKQCDYGIVGDLTKVVPALLARFTS